MAQNRTILLAGNGPYANRGCEAIVRGTTAVLREIRPFARFISSYFPHPGCDDARKESDPGLEHRPFPRFAPFTWLWAREQVSRRVFGQPIHSVSVGRVLPRALAAADLVLMLGGDNYTLDYGSHRIFFRMNELALNAGKPVVIWGASIGPFTRAPETERWAAQALQRVTLIAARETETVAYLDRIGVRDNVVLTADPAFHLQPQPVSLPDEIEAALQAGAIGLNLSPLLHRYMDSAEHGSDLPTRWVEIAVEIIAAVQAQISDPLLLIPHVTTYRADPGRDDYLFLRQVRERVPQPTRVLLLGNNLNAAETKYVIGRVRAFAGARTHSTLAAISSGVPTICIGYSMKARGIAQDTYGHLDWLVDSQVLMREPALLAQKLQALLPLAGEMRAAMASQVSLFQARVRETAVAVANLLP